MAATPNRGRGATARSIRRDRSRVGSARRASTTFASPRTDRMSVPTRTARPSTHGGSAVLLLQQARGLHRPPPRSGMPGSPCRPPRPGVLDNLPEGGNQAQALRLHHFTPLPIPAATLERYARLWQARRQLRKRSGRNTVPVGPATTVNHNRSWMCPPLPLLLYLSRTGTTTGTTTTPTTSTTRTLCAETTIASITPTTTPLGTEPGEGDEAEDFLAAPPPTDAEEQQSGASSLSTARAYPLPPPPHVPPPPAYVL
eukprot:GHVT01043638.1.p1 GENE.GHVT01043638.1~~GHVT01043638.1.p1  ORF type:complete len:256 (-),score=29.95 GHVT01043638.1:19-786(-)